MNLTTSPNDSTPNGYASPPIRLDAGARIVARMTCWRPEYRERFGLYQTVALLASNWTVASCHRAIYDEGVALRADYWKHARDAA
jgi:hypothetical protein